MKKIIFLINILIFSQLSAEENLKFFVKKAIENNLKLNAKRQNLEAVKQKKIFLEVSFYQVLLFPQIKLAQPLQIKLIKADQIYPTQILIVKIKLYQ